MRVRRAAERALAWQPAGFQCVMRLALHTVSVCALALATAGGLLALGDESGRLSLVDLRQARHPSCFAWQTWPAARLHLCKLLNTPCLAAQATMRYSRQLADQPIAALAFGSAAAPPRGLAERLSERRLQGEAPGEREARLALYVAAADCSMAAIEAASGEPLGRDAWLRPRATDSALALLPLNAAGEPLPPPSAPLLLAWAHGSLGAPPACLAWAHVRQMSMGCLC